MRILFLSTWFPHPPDNGSKLRIYHLLLALAAEHQVTLGAFYSANENVQTGKDKLLQFCDEVFAVPSQSFRPGSLRAVLGFLNPKPRVLVDTFSPEMAESIQAAISKNGYDLVIASQYGMADYSKYFHGIPAIFEELELGQFLDQTPTDSGDLVNLQKLRLNLMQKKLRTHMRSILPDYRAVTVVSEREKQLTMTTVPQYQGRVSVIPNGVDCDYNRSELFETNRRGLVYNGALTYQANYDAMAWFLTNIYPAIRRQTPEITLAITGSTRGVDRSGLTLDDSVQLTGYVDDIRVPVASAAVCVVPLRQGGGSRLKILEAMALGAPVVSTSTGAEGLDGQHGQHLLIADTPQDFAAAVVQLLHDRTLATRLAGNARRLVETRYDWSTITPRYLELVEQVVSGEIMAKMANAE